jgi:hypothetical protein
VLNRLNQPIQAGQYEAAQYVLILSKVLGISALLLATGLWLGDTSSSNYAALLNAATNTTWALIFASYGIAKIIQSGHDLPNGVDILISVIGIWLWNYLFFSFVLLDTREFTAVELLLLLPVACEFWELALDIFAFRIRYKKKG